MAGTRRGADEGDAEKFYISRRCTSLEGDVFRATNSVVGEPVGP